MRQVGGMLVWLTLVLVVGNCVLAHLEQSEHAQLGQSQPGSLRNGYSNAVAIFPKKRQTPPGRSLLTNAIRAPSTSRGRSKRAIAIGTILAGIGILLGHTYANEGTNQHNERMEQIRKQGQAAARRHEESIQLMREQGNAAASRHEESIILSREQMEAAADRHDDTMRLTKYEICAANCAGEWTMWTKCSKPCGGGSTRRTRSESLSLMCKRLGGFKCSLPMEQKAWCNLGCEHGGTPNPSNCSCRPGWEAPCCLTEAICEHPGKPSHGEVEGTWPATFRSRATFQCDPGYALIGAEEIGCRANGSWTGRKPQCRGITCTAPNRTDHVQILNPDDSYNYDDEVVYMCEDGYSIRGPERRKCKTDEETVGRWTGFDPICAAVRCDDPGEPIDGERHGHVFTYGSSVNFTCIPGYKLIGSSKMRCLASGRWLGRFPECVQIQCDSPLVPKNGNLILRRANYGALVSFECDAGHNLVGDRVLRCELSGNWNGTEPRCQAAICDNPGIPVHGAKDGSIYYFPHEVHFSCFNGYLLMGMDTISCQSDGTWSFPLPVCEACPSGTYMDDTHEVKQCIACPEYTHTLIEGSTSRRQCVCNDGYIGPDGGPCQEIRCTDLSAPYFGTINECENQLNHSCLFNCTIGYILDKGSSMRTCQSNGEWDGQQPSCSACMKDTYQFDVRSCMPCPANSHTDDVANVLEGCVCNNGYQGPPGGPCVDVNECLENDGRGPCSDLCENRVGDYKCDCSIPGYGIDPDNEHMCIVEMQCKNLTEEEAPINGGLVCHWYYEQNSQHCSTRCNQGFEFPSRQNDYETCGPNLAFKWSFRLEDPKAFLPPCVKEFFPGMQMESESYYFVRDCANLTEEEKLEVMETFAATLNENDVCSQRASKNCEIKDMGIICGRRELRRRKRGIDETLHSIDFAFNISALAIRDSLVDCPLICASRHIPERFCTDVLCNSVNKRYMRAAVLFAKRKLERLYETAESKANLTFTAASRAFEPESVITSDVIIDCPEGMKSLNENCVPCNPGHYYEKAGDSCLPCPRGMSQILPMQTSCEMCPVGSTTYNEGSLWCEVCRNNTFGERCEQSCECSENGQCDRITGECRCQNGWAGDGCDIDVNGCDNHGCYEGVNCTDIAAPGSGFSCGSCPPGLDGDGSTCVG